MISALQITNLVMALLGISGTTLFFVLWVKELKNRK